MKRFRPGLIAVLETCEKLSSNGTNLTSVSTNVTLTVSFLNFTISLYYCNFLFKKLCLFCCLLITTSVLALNK